MSDTTPRVGPELIRAYVLDEPLADADRLTVERELGATVERVAVTPLRVFSADNDAQITPDARRVRPLLRAAGIARDHGRRTILVSPVDAAWGSALADAIALETGRYPILVETPQFRAQTSDPGPLRVVDIETTPLGGSPD